MIISKRRIRNLEANLPGVKSGSEIVLAFPVDQVKAERLAQLGLNTLSDVGDTALPAVVGPVTRYNAEGRYIIHRDQPKETVYRQIEWTWTEYHGQSEVEQSGIKDVPYQRYPRTFSPPPGIELTLVEVKGVKMFATQPYVVNFTDSSELRHALNMMLEAWNGQCHVLTKELDPVSVIPTKSLNWEVLPAGKMPWKVMEPLLKEVIESQKKGNKPVVAHRLETINYYEPEFVARGSAGFSGYVIFGFTKLDFFVLECSRYGNATYVLRKNWEEISALTKGEILDGNLHHARYVHLEGWPLHIDKLLRSNKLP